MKIIDELIESVPKGIDCKFFWLDAKLKSKIDCSKYPDYTFLFDEEIEEGNIYLGDGRFNYIIGKNK